MHQEPAGLANLWAHSAVFPVSCGGGGSWRVRWADVHLIPTGSLATVLVATWRPALTHKEAHGGLDRRGCVPAPAPVRGPGGTARSGRPSLGPPPGGRDEDGAGDGTEGEPTPQCPLTDTLQGSQGRGARWVGQGGSKMPELPGRGSTLQVRGLIALQPNKQRTEGDRER